MSIIQETYFHVPSRKGWNFLSNSARVDDDGLVYVGNEYADYLDFLDSWLNMHDGGIDDDLV